MSDKPNDPTPLPYSSDEDDGMYRCPVCTFEMYVGPPSQDGVGVVGTTRFAVKHSGCGIVWPPRSSTPVLSERPAFTCLETDRVIRPRGLLRRRSVEYVKCQDPATKGGKCARHWNADCHPTQRIEG